MSGYTDTEGDHHPTPDAPCARCGEWVSAFESMVVRAEDDSLHIVHRWGTPCAGSWVPP